MTTTNIMTTTSIMTTTNIMTYKRNAVRIDGVKGGVGLRQAITPRSGGGPELH